MRGFSFGALELVPSPLVREDNVATAPKGVATGRAQPEPKHRFGRWRRPATGLRGRFFGAVCELAARCGICSMKACRALKVAHPAGFEPAVPSFVDWCLIQFGHGCVGARILLANPATGPISTPGVFTPVCRGADRQGTATDCGKEFVRRMRTRWAKLNLFHESLPGSRGESDLWK